MLVTINVFILGFIIIGSLFLLLAAVEESIAAFIGLLLLCVGITSGIVIYQEDAYIGSFYTTYLTKQAEDLTNDDLKIVNKKDTDERTIAYYEGKNLSDDEYYAVLIEKENVLDYKITDSKSSEVTFDTKKKISKEEEKEKKDKQEIEEFKKEFKEAFKEDTER